MARKHFGGKTDVLSKLKSDLDRKVGNYRGGSFSLSSVDAGTYRDFTMLIVILKETIYVFEVMLVGGKDLRQTLGQPLGALLGGVEFVDTKEHVMGPLAVDGVLAHNAPRGRFADQERDLTVPGFTGKKPKGVAEVDFRPEADPALRAAFEARAPDGQTYLYFDVHAYDAANMMRADKKPEDIVKAREGEWKSSNATDPVTITKGKMAWFDATFAGEKGIGYHFTGTSGGFPFIEYGWVFKAKSNYMWVRMQFAGEGAEKTMEAHAKVLKRLKPI
jgi:hypothetical protein